MKLGILGRQSVYVLCDFNYKLILSNGKNELKVSSVTSKNKDSCHVQSLPQNYYFMNGYLT
jgi:hypothetical protein